MPEDIVVAQCSPTMAGLKTGNLFTCRMESKRETDDSIRRFNARFASRGVRLLLLKYDARKRWSICTARRAWRKTWPIRSP